MSELKKPNWLFKPINVPDLDKIQKEFYYIFETYYSDMFDTVCNDITILDINIVKKNAPTYVNFLKELNLLDILMGVAFSGSHGEQTETCPIHIDIKDWKSLSIALNLPVIGCEDSYTAFYQVVESDGVENSDRITKKYPTSLAYPDATSKEIARLPVLQPAWINVSAPHRPITAHTNLRLIVTTRFFPEIFNYFENETI